MGYISAVGCLATLAHTHWLMSFLIQVHMALSDMIVAVARGCHSAPAPDIMHNTRDGAERDELKS